MPKGKVTEDHPDTAYNYYITIVLRPLTVLDLKVDMEMDEIFWWL